MPTAGLDTSQPRSGILVRAMSALLLCLGTDPGTAAGESAKELKRRHVPRKPASTVLSDHDAGNVIVVKFHEGTRVRKRADKLVAQGILSKTEQETLASADLSAKANVASARATLSQAQAALEQAETNLDYAVIVSPIDGIVISRDVDIGQTLAASMTPPILFTIAEDLTKLQLEVNVDESDVGLVAEGQKASFTVGAYLNRRYPASVNRVAFGSTKTDNVVTYTTRLNVDNEDLTLRPGMTATATIQTSDRKPSLLVPNTALRFTPAPLEIRARYTQSHRLPMDIQRLAIDRAKTRMYPTADTGEWRELDNEPPLPEDVQFHGESLNDETGGSYYDLILIKSSTTVSIESPTGAYACP